MYLKYKKQNKTKTWLRYVFFVAAIAGWVLSYNYVAPPTKVDAFLKSGCYTAYQGSDGSTIYTASTCPNKAPTNGNIAGKCFVAFAASSQGVTEYAEKNCLAIGPAPTTEADCVTAGGVWRAGSGGGTGDPISSSRCDVSGPPSNALACEAIGGVWSLRSGGGGTGDPSVPAKCDISLIDECRAKEGAWIPDSKTCNLNSAPTTQSGCENRGGAWQLAVNNGSQGIPAGCSMTAVPTSEVACKVRKGNWSGSACALATAPTNTIKDPNSQNPDCPATPTGSSQDSGCVFIKKIYTGDENKGNDASNAGDRDAASNEGRLCGRGEKAVITAIPLGCRGNLNPNDPFNPIYDMLFAFVRLLSAGVGIALVIGMVIAGLMYTTSRGDPQATAKAIERIRAVITALLVYIFAYALLNYLVPGGLLV